MSELIPNRLNLALTGENITKEAEDLRTLMERRLNKRLSMAAVFKMLMIDALAKERSSVTK